MEVNICVVRDPRAAIFHKRNGWAVDGEIVLHSREHGRVRPQSREVLVDVLNRDAMDLGYVEQDAGRLGEVDENVWILDVIIWQERENVVTCGLKKLEVDLKIRFEGLLLSILKLGRDLCELGICGTVSSCDKLSDSNARTLIVEDQHACDVFATISDCVPRLDSGYLERYAEGDRNVGEILVTGTDVDFSHISCVQCQSDVPVCRCLVRCPDVLQIEMALLDIDMDEGFVVAQKVKGGSFEPGVEPHVVHCRLWR